MTVTVASGAASSSTGPYVQRDRHDPRQRGNDEQQNHVRWSEFRAEPSGEQLEDGSVFRIEGGNEVGGERRLVQLCVSSSVRIRIAARKAGSSSTGARRV